MAPRNRTTRIDLSPVEMEAALFRLQALPPEAPEAIAVQNTLLLAVRGIVVRVAQSVARCYPGVPVQDLVQEGLAGLLPVLRTFEPGRAGPGKCLLPGVVAMVARQRAQALAISCTSAVRVTSSARKKAASAARQAKATGQHLGEALTEVGLPASFYEAPASLDGPGLPSLPSEAPATDDLLAAAQQRRALAVAIRNLPDAERLAVRLAFGLDDEQPRGDRALATALGVTCDEARGILDRALRRLRRQLREHE